MDPQKLMWVNSPSTTLTRSFLASLFNFLSDNPQKCYFFFSLSGKQKKKKGAAPTRGSHSPTCLITRHCATPHLPLIPHQVKRHAAPRHSAFLIAAWENFLLCLAKYFPHEITLFLLCYWHNLPCSSHQLKLDISSMEYQWSLFGYKRTINITMIIVLVIFLVLVKTTRLIDDDSNFEVYDNNINSKT